MKVIRALKNLGLSRDEIEEGHLLIIASDGAECFYDFSRKVIKIYEENIVDFNLYIIYCRMLS